MGHMSVAARTAAGLHHADRRTVARHTVVGLIAARHRPTAADDRQHMKAAERTGVPRLRTVAGDQVTAGDLMADRLLPTVVPRLRTVAGRQLTAADPMDGRLLPMAEAEQLRLTAAVAVRVDSVAAVVTCRPVAEEGTLRRVGAGMAVAAEATTAVDVTKPKQSS